MSDQFYTDVEPRWFVVYCTGRSFEGVTWLQLTSSGYVVQKQSPSLIVKLELAETTSVELDQSNNIDDRIML